MRRQAAGKEVEEAKKYVPDERDSLLGSASSSLIGNNKQITGSKFVIVESAKTTATTSDNNNKKNYKQIDLPRDKISSPEIEKVCCRRAACDFWWASEKRLQLNYDNDDNCCCCCCWSANNSSSENTKLASQREQEQHYHHQEQQQQPDELAIKATQAANSNRKSVINMINATKLLSAYFVAELIGTFLLVVIGDGAIAAYVLTKREVDMFTACLAFGVGAMVATFTAAKISGAHINPAATVAFALDGRLSWRLVPIYICAQYLGGFLAALVLMVNYAEAIQALDGGSRSAFGSSNSTGSIFATYPAAWVSPWGSLLDQIVGTAVLLFSLCAVTDKNNANLEDRHQPIYIAFVIGITCVSFNPNCGAIFNPARDLAPRLLTFIFGYSSAFEPVQGLYWLLAGVLGPHIGALIGVFAYKLLIGTALSRKEEYEFELGVGGGQQRHCEHHKRPHQQQQQQQQQQVVPMQTSKFGQI